MFTNIHIRPYSQTEIREKYLGQYFIKIIPSWLELPIRTSDKIYISKTAILSSVQVRKYIGPRPAFCCQIVQTVFHSNATIRSKKLELHREISLMTSTGLLQLVEIEKIHKIGEIFKILCYRQFIAKMRSLVCNIVMIAIIWCTVPYNEIKYIKKLYTYKNNNFIICNKYSNNSPCLRKFHNNTYIE